MNALILATICTILISCDATPQVPSPAAPEIYAPIIQEPRAPAPEPKKHLEQPKIQADGIQQSVDKAWSTTIQYQRKLKEAGK